MSKLGTFIMLTGLLTLFWGLLEIILGQINRSILLLIAATVLLLLGDIHEIRLLLEGGKKKNG